MRIEKIETIPVEIPLTRVFGGSKYAVPSRCTVITRIHTDDGLTSEVYNGDNRTQGPEICKIVQEELAPLVLGEDAMAVERVWEKMFPIAHYIRDRTVVMEAVACVDTALWDLVGKALGVSVSKLFGGFRDDMPIISIGGYYEDGKTLADYGTEMETLKQCGVAGCKFKVGGLTPEEDLARVKAARDGAGPDFLIAIDANRGWSTADAVRFARMVEPYDILWFEEPCHWYDDAAGNAEVRRASSIPIAAGQSEITSHGIKRLIEAGGIDLCNIDASHGGGPTEWRRTAGLCAVHGVRMAHHEEGQIALHTLSGVPHGSYVECFADPERDPIWDGMYANRPPIKDGKIAVPDAPGFGIELDWDMVAKYRID
jgi:D-galactarolactone cycloisomerase